MFMSASFPQPVEQTMSRKFLYSRLVLAVIVILGLLAVMAPPGAMSQGRPELKRPESTTPEKLPEETKPKKKIKGPRAVGVLQLTASGKATLVPIAILVEGKFYDASVYKAEPVPMALESGTVYEAEQAGESLGLFTVGGVLHNNTAGSLHPWMGAGSYLPNGAEAPSSRRRAEDVPVGMDSTASDEPPRLTRGKASKPAASNQTPASGSSTPAANGSSEKPGDKPGTATPPASSQPPSGSSSGSPAGASTGQDTKKPVQTPATAQTSPAQAAPAQTSSDQNSSQTSDNYYRPTLRRGKPTQSAPQEDETAPAGKPSTDGSKTDGSKPGESKTGKPGSPAAAAAAEPVQLVPAISDAGGPDPRPYKFFWKTGEEQDRRDQMLALAADEVRAYANALARNRIPAKPAAPKPAPAGRKGPPKPPPQPVFENMQFRTFDVWVNNQPVMILSAEAHFPPAPGADAPPEQYSITLVARTDIYGNLRKLYSGVTDKFHLDVTPRLDLIDVVDADGDGRGELLFRETSDAGSGYVIYRASADKLTKIFDSLGEQ
jgi:hypothetical protein